jgi:hypothetical protein
MGMCRRDQGLCAVMICRGSVPPARPVFCTDLMSL